MVYATVEVKGRLQSDDLRNCVTAISRIRRLADRGWYAVRGSVPAGPKHPGKAVGAMVEIPRTLAPRSYVFAYDVAGWKTLAGFAAAWKRALSASRNRHLHGAAVLSRNWFV
jgi:hypothetical protein